MSPSRSARLQAFEGRGLFYNVEIEASLDFGSFRFRLMTQPESSNDFVVLLNVRLLQVIEQTSAILDHFQQSASRMVVLFVCLEVLGEFANALT
jgi:hypothetical protein